jgi:hypothetical protein
MTLIQELELARKRNEGQLQAVKIEREDGKFIRSMIRNSSTLNRMKRMKL